MNDPKKEQPAPVETSRPESARDAEPIEQANKAERGPAIRTEKAPPETNKPRLNLPSAKKRVAPPAPIKDAVTIRVENIMQEGLAEAFQKLSPIAQQEFKIKGEETAGKIRELLKSTHIKVKKIFRLIYEWLRLLPGVNKFFLEQEAKIKTDNIVLIQKEQDQARQTNIMDQI